MDTHFLEEPKSAEQIEGMVHEHGKKIIEALLFASNTPLTLNKIRDILLGFYEFKPFEVVTLIHELQKEFLEEKRAVHLEEIADGYILRTAPEYAEYVQELFRDKKGERLSQAGREVLAIIAFKQPITRTQIEAVRGVDSSNIVQSLLDKGLIEEKGQLEAPGRPTLFGVTPFFMQHFGLKDIQELKDLLEKQ